ncbi:MAG: gliding motility protein GldM [Flavobacterium sp.]|jgi:gliding motility-associated protein GldM|uniref:type IX secretion system motor protein PorM/GldM n=1 Tax=Flavobacterium sp. TaxID=239 RepID=UPI0022C23E60|nr:gliding motility protein GldM [Flavobacterium sp.]MCZ8168681.1 gliding motility protein GldM [Flavobacterium sp.]MCZ8296966.1 gliding motility protein GldM [Flavobacterium sp.]
MAGGKLTPRQKMINLMYLVFIAMLALNMSKEVLSAFGLMDEKFEEVNAGAKKANEDMLQVLAAKAGENANFKVALDQATRVKEISKTFYDYLETVKGDITKDFKLDEKTGKLPYEAMDKSNIDEVWFKGDGYSLKGNEIVGAFAKYLSDMKAVLGENVKLTPIVREIDTKFGTKDVKDGEGVTKKYLDYHFKGFPAIATLSKLALMQNDIKKAEADIYQILLGKAAIETMSLKNFKAIVALDKNVYFQGEQVTGKVVIGKYDENVKVADFDGPGKVVNGQAVINATAGSIGEQNLNGSFTFMEDGKPVKLPFEGKYVVVPRPNSANISADKMNVVYRGLPNPMTISIAGISDNNVTATAQGLKNLGKGKYDLNPGAGTEVVINVSGKMTDGKTVTDKKVFRIKNIPAPLGAIGGTPGVQKGAKSRLQASQISAVLPDFLYDLKFRVTQFAFKVPGQPTIIVNGDRLNAQCIAALARVSKGDQVTISDIKSKVDGAGSIIVKDAAPAIYEVQ